ncbi:hypothetical protein DSL60_01305, partial [Metamycoplasma hominis]
VKEIGEGAF